MSRRSRPRNVVLIGFMGTGKTAVGQEVARRLGFRYLDTDTLIEAREGRSIPEIFARDGEAYFREVEAQVVADVSREEGVVIATGGGVVTRPENLERLRAQGWVVWLTATPEVIWERVRREAGRPLLEGCPDPLERIRSLLAVREAEYAQADYVVDTTHRGIQDVAEEIVERFRRLGWEEQA